MTRNQRYLAYAVGGYGLSMNGLAYFLVPLRAHELGASIAVIGLLLAMKAVTETLLSVPLGAVIDAVGPKRAVITAAAATVLLGAALVMATSVVALFLLQLALGAVRPLGWVGGQSYAASMRGGADRTYDTGKFSFAANVGQIVAPLMAGGLATVVGTRFAFSAVALFGAVYVVVALLLPPTARTPRGPGPRESRLQGFLGLFRISDIRAAMLLTFTRLWVSSVWIPFYPLFLVSTGTSKAVAGTVVSSMALAATTTSLFSGRIAKLGRATSVTAAGLGTGCAGVALSPAVNEMPWFYLAAALVGVSQGLSLPMLISIISNAAPPGQGGLALGLRSSVNQTAAAAAPLIVAPIIGLTGLAAGFTVAAVLGLGPLVAALAVVGRAARRRTALSPGP